MSTYTNDSYTSVWTQLMNLPFRQGYVNAGGIRTRYVNAGPTDAPKVILLHGLGGSWENCFANFPVLAEHFNTFAIDMIGHGFTDKPDKPILISDYVTHLESFMDAMKIEKASFLGVSLGSWVTTKLAARSPNRVEKVTMVSAWGRASAKPDISTPEKQRANMQGREARLRGAENPTWEGIQKIFEGLVVDPAKRLSDLVGLRLKIYRQPGMGRAMENIFSGLDAAWKDGVVTDEEAKSIKSPYLIFAAIDSKDVFLACSYEYEKLLSNAKLVDVRGASHWAQWEAVGDFNRINLEFLRS